MKIVKILGGLGNQMFQYALYLSLRHHFPHDVVKVDLSCFRGYPPHNGFEVERVFGLPPAPRATLRDVLPLAWPLRHYRLWQIGRRLLPRRSTMCVEAPNMEHDPTVLALPGPRYYDGYWQDTRYFAAFAPAILRAYRFPPFSEPRNLELQRRMEPLTTASIHIRRGDYLQHPIYSGICTPTYYRRAIATLEARLSAQRASSQRPCASSQRPPASGHPVDLYCVFCNDRAWFDAHILPLLHGRPYVYVDWNIRHLSFRDMQLMSLSSHNIIANSSFSWWGAMLNAHPDKIVIAPSRWLSMPDYRFQLPDGWLGVEG